MSYTKEKFGIDLTKKENWTPLLEYVHKTRLIFGFIIGLIIGLWTRILF